jgi:hypothetical protein
MAAEGPNSAGTGASDSATGTVAWTNTNNISSSDNSRATANVENATSQFLVGTNYSNTIPSATIDGLEYFIEKVDVDSSFSMSHNLLKAVKSGSIVGSDLATATWPNSEATQTFGGASNTLGQSWTSADINATDSGIGISGSGGGNSGEGVTAGVDHISRTIHYTEIAAGGLLNHPGMSGGMQELVGGING